MQFLENSGGVYQSMMILGATIHSLVSGKEQSSYMLKNYFKVEESEESKASKSSYVSFLYQTIFRYLIYCFKWNRNMQLEAMSQ